MGNAIVKLVKKVKKLEGLLKRRTYGFWTDSKKKNLSRMLQGDEQVEDISPNTLEAAKTLSKGTWKLSQLKNLSFEEVKKEFDKLVKQVESFAPINFEATKASLKRFGEELQTKTPKRLKDDEAKDAEPTKKSGKRRKQMARKGLHKDLDDSEDSDEVGKQEEFVTCKSVDYSMGASHSMIPMLI
ncbi:hypothetical protein Tco_0748024 [Tanacetum coccineum]|uniref:Uncharacterized protein n=1 Tax=Tanacetum coccineum TaxID=301880 RepID=A0ABQ4YXF0_9ASTR